MVWPGHQGAFLFSLSGFSARRFMEKGGMLGHSGLAMVLGGGLFAVFLRRLNAYSCMLAARSEERRGGKECRN